MLFNLFFLKGILINGSDVADNDVVSSLSSVGAITHQIQLIMNFNTMTLLYQPSLFTSFELNCMGVEVVVRREKYYYHCLKLQQIICLQQFSL